MKAHRYNFLFVAGLMLTLGLTTAFGSGDENQKRLKHEGMISIRVSTGALPVRIDGKDVGMSGVATGVDHWVTPGPHTIEVLGPNGKIVSQTRDVHIGERVCICLKVEEHIIKIDCPYRFRLEKSASLIKEGETVTFTAVPEVDTPMPLRFVWNVTNGNIIGNSDGRTIVVDSQGFGGKPINADLDVNDGKYDGKCRQDIPISTDVTPHIEPPKPYSCDDFFPANHDQDKARFDSCVVQVQNTPDAQMYVIIYPGTDAMSRSKNTYDKLSKFYLDYMVKNRKLNPGLIKFVKGGSVQKTHVVIWVVPSGAAPPVP